MPTPTPMPACWPAVSPEEGAAGFAAGEGLGEELGVVKGAVGIVFEVEIVVDEAGVCVEVVEIALLNDLSEILKV